MSTLDYIRSTMDLGESMTISLIDDMKDACCTAPTIKGGNHPLWVLGHLAYSEGSMIYGMMLGEDNPLEDLKPVFGANSEPTSDLADYLPFDEVRAMFDQIRGQTRKLMDGLTDADLDKKSNNCPDEWESYFGTWGKCLHINALHVFMHHGQVADSRRSLGRAPMM